MSSPKPYHNTGLSVHQIDLTYAGPGNYILATLQIQKIIRMGPLLQEHDSRKQHNPEEPKTINTHPWIKAECSHGKLNTLNSVLRKLLCITTIVY